jgi:hypothetical protein
MNNDGVVFGQLFYSGLLMLTLTIVAYLHRLHLPGALDSTCSPAFVRSRPVL